MGQAESDSEDTFQRALAREVLRSERRRVTILAAVLGCMLLFWLASAFVFPPSLLANTPMALGERRRVLIVLLAAAFLYELFARTVLGVLLSRDYQLKTRLPRYVNCIIETSLPALVTVGTADLTDPAYAVLLPAPWFYFLFILLSTLRLDFWLCALTGLVAAVEYAMLAIYYVGQSVAVVDPVLISPVHHGAKTVMLLVAGFLAGLVSVQIRQQFANSLRIVEERNRVVNMFGQHVSPAVVDRLLTQEVELGGETRYVCMMFLDIRGFTAFSERRQPDEVLDYLNRLFDFMIESVNRNSGIVNKFLGDGFMAVFGAPISSGQDSKNAVAAAREIVERVETMSAGGEIPPTRIGIGLHAGEAVTGNVGSPLRKEYTIIGDVVNLASRIEQLNKQFGSSLLISETVQEALGADGQDAVSLGPVEVRGLAAPVHLYRLA